MKRVFVETFGCRTNYYDSEYIKSALLRKGYKFVENPEDADIVIVNSCAVTHKAERESRRAVRKYKGLGKNVIYTGCAAKLRPYEEADFSGSVESVLEFFGIKETPTLISLTRTRGVLKVQEGCDFECTYCSIRFSRGKSRSLPLDRILQDAEALAKNTKEIVLTGTQIGDWGKEWGGSLSNLIGILSEKFPEVRFRLSSIEPTHITDELVDLFASRENLCPHFHISAQSGSNKVLRDMKRPYTREVYEDVLNRIYSKIPDVAIGTDIIVAFPTETDEDFEQTLDLIRKYPFAYIHAFEYSPREGTEAYKLGELPADIRKERVKRIQELIKVKKGEYRRKFLGKVLNVLVEYVNNGVAVGFSENYIKVMFEGDEGLKGEIVKVKVVGDRDSGALWGEILRLDKNKLFSLRI
ncbi:MAG: MiaB/RimO family radical SAM methylthiotransferase [candidate division WOR-3 bacterium]